MSQLGTPSGAERIGDVKAQLVEVAPGLAPQEMEALAQVVLDDPNFERDLATGQFPTLAHLHDRVNEETDETSRKLAAALRRGTVAGSP